jgi:hypothetical protein
MTLRLSRVCCIVLVTLIAVTSIPLPARGQGQTITSSELRDAVRKASTEKQKNAEQVRSFFAQETVRNVLDKAGISSERVDKAVSALNADELARLSARTSKIHSDFAAGALSNQDLTYIVIALAAAVLVLVVVAA